MKNLSEAKFFNKAGIYFLILFFAVLSTVTTSCNVDENKIDNKNRNNVASEYDHVRASRLGADDYGMKKYVFAFLKRGPNRPKDPEKSAELQKAHLENIGRLAKEGKLVLAGPFLDKEDLRGIYIFDVESVKEAEELTKTDPAIKYGSLAMELRPWYGSAALLEVNNIHKYIAKKEM